jgi:hypothetical protein
VTLLRYSKKIPRSLIAFDAQVIDSSFDGIAANLIVAHLVKILGREFSFLAPLYI